MGKNSKNVSFYKGVCMCKAKLTFVSFFLDFFFLNLSLSALWCVCVVLSMLSRMQNVTNDAFSFKKLVEVPGGVGY